MLTEAIYTPENVREWSAVLPHEESAFGSVEFAAVAEQHLGYQPRLYVLHDDTSAIAYPFFIRSAPSLLLSEEAGPCVSDTSSPDFTGPVARGMPSRLLALEFAERLAAFFVNQNVIAEFIHLHPWKALKGALRGHCLQLDRQIVYIDLTWTEEQLWRSSFTHACRKNISRSQREKVRVFEAQTTGDIREFHRLYLQTMRERNALEHYFYPLEYFTAMFDGLGGSARFTLAEYKDQVVAGTLYLHDRDDVYSYLGGADINFQHVRPTNAVIYETMLWAKNQGKKRMLLGGGYTPDDGVMRFKASFSPQRASFLVYRCIQQSEKYDELCRAWSCIHGCDAESGNYFPRYRRPPNPERRETSYPPLDSQPASIEATY